MKNMLILAKNSEYTISNIQKQIKIKLILKKQFS